MTQPPTLARVRYDLAHRHAAALWDAGVTADQVQRWPATGWDVWCARVPAPPAPDGTRDLVWHLLAVKEAWAEANPKAQDADRRVLTDDEAAALVAPPPG